MLPEKPLKILTIDGGGLQAISTLLILDKLLDTIAKSNKVPLRKPRPCDVFDTIAGIGAGGWLAILLGRFHMDITTCLSEWYKITQRIAPRSKTEEIRMRAFHHCYFHPERLVEQIDTLTKVYGTGEYLFDSRTNGVRTRHVFVAALRADATGYNLFRTYAIPADAKLANKLLEGPENPERFRIPRAFGVTGAAKYFSPPWNEQLSTSGRTRFADNNFPNPHNITELALDEMPDVKQIAQRFSWGLNSPLNTSTYTKRPRSPKSDEVEIKTKRTRQKSPSDTPLPSPQSPSVRFQESAGTRDAGNNACANKQQLDRNNTFGSIRDRRVGKKLRRLESDIEQDIKKKLNNLYQGGGPLYYRLAPGQAPRGTAQNDSSAPGVALDATLEYLREPVVLIKIDEITNKMPEIAAAG